ncbi:hypothetical protein [Burkholderia latens]|uniref:Fis family transcriptional regulator n=1 Tax=Burkholderia latens TaxID=488446 RepID=A0A6H9TLY7_9BURK|nr:hypothetical protein [Burkholderia latens]KAB0644796.1 hypothetical protein F7R21_00310 [Burkholderia latens]VWB17290.1 Fis family transcriptional regulator [Burkholderia latens]
MLLPLSAGVARRLSLENHLALATIQSGNGTADTMIALMRVLYMTYFLLETNPSDVAIDMFLTMETALDESIRATEDGNGCTVSEDTVPVIRGILLQFDSAIASVPKHHYIKAVDRFTTFALSPHQSPLPGSRVEGLWEQ